MYVLLFGTACKDFSIHKVDFFTIPGKIYLRGHCFIHSFPATLHTCINDFSPDAEMKVFVFTVLKIIHT